MITEPGTYPHLSDEDYHADPALGSTGLRNVLRSPLTYYSKHLDPNRPKAEPTAAMVAGTLTHLLLLQPDRFHEQYTVRPSWVDGRKADGKEWLAANKDRIILTEEQMHVAEGQVASIKAKPMVYALFEGCQSELPMFWRDPETGVLCKIKPDSIKQAGGGVVLADLKTTSDASPAGFSKSAGALGYHIQQSFYCEGYEAVTGVPVIGFVFVAVSNEYPYDCAMYMLDDVAESHGKLKVRQALNAYAKCKADGVWPGFGSDIKTLSLPPWTLKD